jgi:transcriptional regulator GlxA family with amidase domain
MSNFVGKENVGFYPSTSNFSQAFAKLARQRPLPGSLDLICQMLQLVASVLNEKQGSSPKSPASKDETSERIVSVIQQLRGSELEDIKVEDLAQKCGCSRRHLGRVFREHFGDSISSHKMGLRLEKAARLLLNTNSRIIDVANACGFVHIGQFSAKFREKYGDTPSKWRQIASTAPQLRLETEENNQDLGLIAL